MDRLSELSLENFTPRQREIYDQILTRRASINGPFLAWMHNPELADRAQELGAYCRFDTCLPLNLSELAILVVARHWRSQAEWAIHAPIANKAGIKQDDIDAMLEGRDPAFADPDCQIIYSYTSELLQTARVSDETHSKASAALGENGVVDLVALIGYYGLVALTLNAFNMPVPNGGEAPFT